MKTGGGMRLFILAALLLAFTPSTALPWGWGAHAYFANRFGAFFGLRNLQEIYGAVLPDVYAAIPSLAVQEQFYVPTHYNFVEFVQEARPVLPAVGRGFASHNEIWGADSTAHIQNLTLGTEGGYVIVKQNQLVENNKALFDEITVSLPPPIAELVVNRAAHAAVEVAVDLWLRRKQDPAWGARLFLAASLRDSRIPDLLVKAYKDEPGIDESEIRNAEAVFRQAAIAYSWAFLHKEEVTVQLLSAQAADQLRQDVELISNGSIELAVDPNDLTPILYAAMELVKDDYFGELSATLGMIRANLYTIW